MFKEFKRPCAVTSYSENDDPLGRLLTRLNVGYSELSPGIKNVPLLTSKRGIRLLSSYLSFLAVNHGRAPVCRGSRDIFQAQLRSIMAKEMLEKRDKAEKREGVRESMVSEK